MALDPLALHRSLHADGPAPRLSWSSRDGEQLELSGRVLANWTAKVANLLVEEVDSGPGTRVLLDLPVHWRTLVWALGTWVTGATVVVADGDGEDAVDVVDVVVTTRPERWLATCDVVAAVTLPSFALRWPGELPGHALDGSADVAAQPDALGPVPAVDLTSPALVGTDGGVAAFADLGTTVAAESPTEDPVGDSLRRTVAALCEGDGVIVALDDGATA